jgi:hypothetical protein
MKRYILLLAVLSLFTKSCKKFTDVTAPSDQLITATVYTSDAAVKIGDIRHVQ